MIQGETVSDSRRLAKNEVFILSTIFVSLRPMFLKYHLLVTSNLCFFCAFFLKSYRNAFWSFLTFEFAFREIGCKMLFTSGNVLEKSHSAGVQWLQEWSFYVEDLEIVQFVVCTLLKAQIQREVCSRFFFFFVVSVTTTEIDPQSASLTTYRTQPNRFFWSKWQKLYATVLFRRFSKGNGFHGFFGK